MDGLTRLAAGLADRVDGLAVLLHDVAEQIAQSVALVDFWRSIERARPAVQAADRRNGGNLPALRASHEVLARAGLMSTLDSCCW